MEEKLVNFMLEKSLYSKLKALAVRENRTIKDILTEEVERYCKVHDEGNPQHTMDSFSENSDFWGFPSIAIDIDKKSQWITNEKTTDKVKKALFWHIQEWKTRLEREGFVF